MPLDDQHSWALLRQLDDPDHMEFPRGYDHVATRAKFDQLTARLDQRFDCTCVVDRHVQDASRHGTIVIPSAATDSTEHITVTISNFGYLAVITLGNPGSYDEEEERELFQSTHQDRIDDELKAVLESGCSWRKLPASFPVHWRTTHRRFAQWVAAGVMTAVHRGVLDVLGAAGQIDWSRASIDAMQVRAVKRGT